jgi:murein L,D-transpeptidase YcbB/YkuD
MVNVPEFYARLYRDNQLILSTPVIVGKPKTHSPLFSSKISYLIVNPSWNVPQSIIRKEMAHDLDKWRRKGFIIRRIDGRLHIRQPPGDDNALGRIKFEFPNKYAVYLHDTNQRYLFRRSVRAFSHGCIRVDNPLDLAVALLRPERGWDEARLESMYGPQSRPVYLPEPMPLHVVYFTMRVDENGDLRRFADIYGYMDQMRALLGLDG